jgi:hypothetical protein
MRKRKVRYTKHEEESLVGPVVGKFIRYQVIDDTSGRAVTVHEWAESLLKHDKTGNSPALQLCQTLASVPFTTFVWETPGVENVAAARRIPMEFVVVSSSTKRHNRVAVNPFGDDIVVFSRSKDALIVVAPPPASPALLNSYIDLAAFCRGASPVNIDALWQLLAAQYLKQLSETKCWLSSRSDGLDWLHFRLDLQSPKYYIFTPYAVTEKTNSASKDPPAPQAQLPVTA